jgi:hypothetical protein
MSFTNNAGRARHSVRAAAWQRTRSAGRGLPALPILPSLFVKGIIPEIRNKKLEGKYFVRLYFPAFLLSLLKFQA